MFLFSELGVNLSWKFDNAVMVALTAASSNQHGLDQVEAMGVNQATDLMSYL